LLTQRLIIQPRLDASLSFNKIEELEIGPGLAALEFSVRLRYEIRRELAPYIGLAWHTLSGGTRDIAKIEGSPRDVTALFVGVRFWF